MNTHVIAKPFFQQQPGEKEKKKKTSTTGPQNTMSSDCLKTLKTTEPCLSKYVSSSEELQAP